MYHLSQLAKCSSISDLYRAAASFCIRILSEYGRGRMVFMRVLQSSECQVDKYMGWPDRSLSICLSPPSHCQHWFPFLQVTAEWLQITSATLWCLRGRGHQAEMTLGGDRRTPRRHPPTWLPFTAAGPMTLIWFWSVKGLFFPHQSHAKTGNDQQGRPFLCDLQVLQKNLMNFYFFSLLECIYRHKSSVCLFFLHFSSL